MLCQLLEGASYISEELLEGRGYITEVIRRKGGQTKSFSTAVCRVLLFHCIPLLHGQHAKCSIYFHIQLKPTRKMRSQVPCTNYHVWWPLHQQLTNNEETSWLLWQYLPLSAQFDLQNSVPIEFSWLIHWTSEIAYFKTGSKGTSCISPVSGGPGKLYCTGYAEVINTACVNLSSLQNTVSMSSSQNMLKLAVSICMETGSHRSGTQSENRCIKECAWFVYTCVSTST